MTIYLVYPTRKNEISTPWVIGNEIVNVLRFRDFDLCAHVFDWDECGDIDPARGDILIGHPHPGDGKTFREALKNPRWSKKIAVFPWAGAPKDVAFVDAFVKLVDHCIVVCGPYWRMYFKRQWPNASVSFMDLGVDVATHPKIKGEFSPVGKRRIAYVGCCTPEKGTLYLEQIIARMPDVEFGHFGYGQVAGARQHGRVDFSTNAGRALLAEYDFIINCGMHDANPTPVIEAASWGLISMAAPQCGWGEDVTIYFPLDNVDAAVDKIRSIISLPGESLLARQAQVLARLPQYTWSRVLEPIIRAIEVSQCQPIE